MSGKSKKGKLSVWFPYDVDPKRETLSVISYAFIHIYKYLTIIPSFESLPSYANQEALSNKRAKQRDVVVAEIALVPLRRLSFLDLSRKILMANHPFGILMTHVTHGDVVSDIAYGVTDRLFNG